MRILGSIKVRRSWMMETVSPSPIHPWLRSATQQIFIRYLLDYVPSLPLTPQNAFDSRAKAYLAWQSSMVELDKRRLSLERLRATLRPSPATAFNAANDTSRHTALRAEITALELRTFAREREFRRVSDTLRDELARFEYERTEEFVAVVAKYLDSLIAMQREVVTLWRALVARGRGEEARVGEGGRSEDASNSASNSMTRTGNVADATDSATAASATTNGDDGASAFTGQNEAIYYRSGEGPPF